MHYLPVFVFNTQNLDDFKFAFFDLRFPYQSKNKKARPAFLIYTIISKRYNFVSFHKIIFPGFTH